MHSSLGNKSETPSKKKKRASYRRNNPTFNRKDVHSEKIGRNQHKKDENIKVQNAYSPQRDHNDSSAWPQNRSENDFHELTEAGFRRWVITNFSELRTYFNPMQRN